MAFSVRGMRVMVVGAARSGLAAAELLTSRGARVTVADCRTAIEAEARLRELGIDVELGDHNIDSFKAADLIVVSPGVPLRQPAIDAARAAAVPILGEVELASRWLRGRVVAITGTKGKSTTTALVGRMLAAAGFHAPVGGNIGTPLSAQVADSTPETLHVVEVSSFQLETTETFHPWIAVLLNFSRDHLDRHASVAEYAEAKRRMFRNQTAADWAVVNADDPGTRRLAAGTLAKLTEFGMRAALDEGVTVADGQIVHRAANQNEPLVPLSDVRLMGRHLLMDVLAAVAASRLAGASPRAMREAVSTFTGLEHAMEFAGEIAGVRFINDSKATNIESALRAIETFERGEAVILGGRFKGGDFRDLREPLRGRATAVVAIGEAAPLIHEALGDVVRILGAPTMHDAVRVAFGSSLPGGVVLLAPGCASFDMFTDYGERGRIFKQEVERLAEEVGRTREQ
jgi:UDP-N-acetylmuramoylalanine--D-glutamate ligase